MQNIFIILQIIFSISLVILIIMQPKGTGFARSFGGGGSSFTRRGLEKLIFKATFAVSFLFLLVSILNIL